MVDIFDEWRELFTKYRSHGKLPEKERKRFRELSAELRASGVLPEKNPEELIERYGLRRS